MPADASWAGAPHTASLAATFHSTTLHVHHYVTHTHRAALATFSADEHSVATNRVITLSLSLSLTLSLSL